MKVTARAVGMGLLIVGAYSNAQSVKSRLCCRRGLHAMDGQWYQQVSSA
jgi:hypothetical protein